MRYNFPRMSGSPPGRAQYTVACTCGIQLTLDARGFGVPKACRGCGGTVTVAWGRDPKTRMTVPVAMTRPPKAKPGDRDYIGTCPCGYHRPVSASEHDKKPRCAKCGKVMNITVSVGEGPKSRPSAPLLPLYLRAKDALQTVVKKNARFFDCVCGLRLTIRPGMEGQKIRCPDCDRIHAIESKAETSSSRPPKTAVPTPRPAPKQRSAAPPPEAAPAPTRPLSLGEFLCECGEIQPPRTSRTGREFVCKKCGRKGRVETDKDPKTGLPTMRPVFTSGPTAAPAPPPEAPKPAPVPEGAVSFEELSPMEVSFAEGDAPPTIDADAQIVPCECGAEILLSANDAGHTIQCPACADKMLVEGTTDARTGAVSIKLRLVGALDDPDWKLEEFQ
jgi:hypothetical protein